MFVDGFVHQLPDTDPDETTEWLDSLDAVIDARGKARARYLLARLMARANEHGVGVPSMTSTPYINTIPPEQEPWFPGDEHIERRIRAFVRWNAVAMVDRAEPPLRRARRPPLDVRVGGRAVRGRLQPLLPRQGRRRLRRPGVLPGSRRAGHLRPRVPRGSADRGAPRRVPARGLGDASASRATRTRAACRTSGSSRPSRWASARSTRSRRPASTATCCTTRSPTPATRRVWAFVGDGEMDEPESIAGLSIAARENLDNLIFVVNCNLQRLDGPVRGNDKVIQELEMMFRGAGWNVIKVVWGREWDELLARDVDGVLVNKMNSTVDGEFQKYAIESGAYIREHFFGPDPRLQQDGRAPERRGPAAAAARRARLPQALRRVPGRDRERGQRRP